LPVHIVKVPLVEGKRSTGHGTKRIVDAASCVGSIFFEKRARQDDLAAGSALIAFSFPFSNTFLHPGRKEKTQKKPPELSFQARGDQENSQKPVGEHSSLQCFCR
jgi:hypothetical protein